jgi:uncharacterized protein
VRGAKAEDRRQETEDRMNAAAAPRLGDFHLFEAAGRRFVYSGSGAVFELDEEAARAVERIGCGVQDSEVIQELRAAGIVGSGEGPGVDTSVDTASTIACATFPLQTVVLNLTNQCNLACQYCYEFGADRVATPEGKPKFMDSETAKAAVDMLFEQSGARRGLHITFFGGETLMNFPLLKEVVEYGGGRAAAEDRSVDFSLTTNATLLTPAIIAFLAEQRIGVTVSIDGPKEMNDQLRVFANGRGSYDVIEPKIRMLLERHRTRPIAARVTLTSGVTDVAKIYRHLKHDLGFHEVGFAPVTTSPHRLYAINERGMNGVLEQFRALAEEYLEFAVAGRHHGFSNVSDTLAEVHQGVNKSHPCGAGLGLVGVGPSGDIAPCHRFVDSDAHALGHVSKGIDRARQAEFLTRGHIQSKYECHSCWARPLCAGGCHHEAFVHYGDTGHPNLHYCDWIREWTDVCLQVYGTLAVKNPRFLEHFAERRAA